MRKTSFLPALACLLAIGLFVSNAVFAEAKPPAKKPPVVARKATSLEVADDEAVYYKYRIVSSLGMTVIRTMGWGFGAQFAFNPNRGSFFVGPEAQFSLFNGGSMLAGMAGAWHEMRISGAPRLGVAIGALVGGAFSTGIPNVPSTSLIFLGDLDISHEIDDLTAIRGQFRPGIVGNYFSFMMLLGATFRFK